MENAHFKITSFMCSFLFIDLGLLVWAVYQTIQSGPSLLIFFGFEYALLSLSIMNSLCKYWLNSMEAEGVERSLYLFYIDIAIDFFKLLSYVIFFAVVINFYGLPIHIIRDVYLTLRQFVKRCQDFVKYRQATANMEQRYPTPTEQELNMTDRVCIVCREDMVLPDGHGNPPKKLPCGHIFHLKCLKSWLERQQSCPTW